MSENGCGSRCGDQESVADKTSFWRLGGALRRRATGAKQRQQRPGLRPEPLEPRYVLTDVGGLLTADTVWDQAGSPYNVTADITVPVGITLEIEPGVVVEFQDDTGIAVTGRLLAEGTATQRITMDRAPGASRWDGLEFTDTLTDSRITYADMHYGDGQGEAINLVASRLLLDNITWTGTTGTILELENPSLIVRNSQFPTSNGGEIIHGEHLVGSEYLIIEGNVFANSNNGGDVIDILGADRPGPVMQILNNVFLGGGDDGLDLDGTDAHIEGNLFMNFRLNTGRATTANAIATGLPQSGEPNRTEVTIVRNIFVNSDHAILIKEDAFGTIEHNTFIGMSEAVIQFGEVGGTLVGGPGRGGYLDGNIFHDNAALFKNLVDDGGFQTDLIVNRSLMPNEVVDFDGTPINAHDLGTGNVAGDPLFVDQAGGNYRLQSGSPAAGAGPFGLDMGAYVPAGPTISGVPDGPASSNDQTFLVGGPGITHYRYRLNDGPYGDVTPVSQPIELVDLPNGDYTIDILGRNDAGEWFAGQTPAFGENTAEILTPTRARTGEILPVVVRVRDSHGNVNSLLTTPASLDNAADLGTVDMEVKKGIGSFNPIVTGTSDFAVAMAGELASSPTRDVAVLDGTFPVQTYAGTLSGDTVWDATAERQITGDILVPAGSRLTIEAGTRVMLGDQVNIRVEGEITVTGTAAEPVMFNALQRTAPWGGLEVVDGSGTIQYAFFTNGGADDSRAFGHSDSQPLVMVDGSTLDFANSFVINNVGKAFGSRNDAVINIHQAVISDVDTGAQFNDSIVTVTESMLKNIPNGDGVFDDDDNDGFYFLGVHSSGEPSVFQDSFVVTTKDDGLDHNGARLRVVRAWIEGAAHEGIASSNRNWVTVEDSVFMHNNQGVEAGYQMPDVTVSNSVFFDNDNVSDANSPITAGLRFGDGYDGSNGDYEGHITAFNNVLHDNGDNVRNYDGTIPGPQEGAIDITYSMTNDPDYNLDPGNFAGTPVFGPFMHLLRGSDGLNAGNDGLNVGRKLPPITRSFSIDSPEPLLRIDEVVATAAADQDRVELFNGGGAAVDLSGMSITNDPANPTLYVFPAGTTLASGERLVLYADNGLGVDELHLGFELNHDGDEVALFDAVAGGQTLLDEVVFGKQLDGYSLARRPSGTWSLATPTVGAPNQLAATATPDALRINEWLAVGDATYPDDFIELFNTATLPVDMGNLQLTNDPAGQLDLFTIRPLSFVAGRGFAVFIADNDPAAGGDHVNFTLDAASGAIALSHVDSTIIDRIDYGPQTAGVSQGRRPNGGAFIDFFDEPNPGADNPGDPAGPIAPQNLTATLVSGSQVDLAWDAIVDPNSTVAFYRIYRDGNQIGTTPTVTFSDTTVVPGFTYVYEVAGVDTDDTEGARSTPVQVEVQNLVMFQQGVFPNASYSGTTDTWLRASNPTNNYGNNARMDADGDSGGQGLGEWSVIRWDLSSIDPAEVVSSVSVTLEVNNDSDTAYGIYPLTRSWVELEATWEQAANGQPWQQPGTGPDERGAQIGSLFAASTGSVTVEFNQLGIATVQAWVEDPSRNFGIIIYNPAATDGMEMRTSEYDVASERPKLTIGLEVPDVMAPFVTANDAVLNQTPQEVRYSFNEEVFVGLGDLRLDNLTTSETISGANMQLVFDADTNTAIWTFPGLPGGVLPSGEYAARLVIDEIVDLDGNPLQDSANTEFSFTWLRGDVTVDGVIDGLDIAALCGAQTDVETDPNRDLDSDGDVDRTDIDTLVRGILGTEYGDANLDGSVDATDLGIWREHRFEINAGWADGDFDCNGSVDGRDFNIWNQNKFTVSQAAETASLRTPRAPLAGAPAQLQLEAVDAASAVRAAAPRFRSGSGTLIVGRGNPASDPSPAPQDGGRDAWFARRLPRLTPALPSSPTLERGDAATPKPDASSVERDESLKTAVGAWHDQVFARWRG